VVRLASASPTGLGASTSASVGLGRAVARLTAKAKKMAVVRESILNGLY
jgi:hypothetical protein